MRDAKIKWNKLTTRQMTDEEREVFPAYCFMWEGRTPELFEEVLVFDGNNFYIDRWTEFDVGEGFENVDTETCYWVSFDDLMPIETEK